jgi:hypothetical protein
MDTINIRNNKWHYCVIHNNTIFSCYKLLFYSYEGSEYIKLYQQYYWWTKLLVLASWFRLSYSEYVLVY